MVDLPAADPPAPAAPVPQPVAHTVPPPQVDPTPTLTPPPIQPLAMTVSPVVAAVGTASDGTTGHGPGTGGGTGAGVGTGVGNDSGPGSSGNGAYILPYARMVLIPPKCVHGDFTLRFWVEVDGSVSRLSVEPVLKDGDCRREVMDRMKGFQFLPARRDGRPVPAVYTMTMHQ